MGEEVVEKSASKIHAFPMEKNESERRKFVTDTMTDRDRNTNSDSVSDSNEIKDLNTRRNSRRCIAAVGDRCESDITNDLYRNRTEEEVHQEIEISEEDTVLPNGLGIDANNHINDPTNRKNRCNESNGHDKSVATATE